jgi:predicted HNH restriction endonuclease
MNNIINNILPGNYWLSKSMEFSKFNTSGSLWYLKKWFVFYHYVFLKANIYDSDYAAISQIFTDYIESLPQKDKKEAYSFFFQIEIRKNKFLKFNDFIQTNLSFNDAQEEKRFIIAAKRFYFMYLMNLGGQSGYKLIIKNKLLELKSYETIVNEISKIILKDGHNNAKVIEQLSDFPAAIRNERQIYFYYGFFHGRESKDLSGFYNLTPIGKATLKANFAELLIIWEHQKIKMISQSPVADIQNLIKVTRPEAFSILNNPYITLLKIIAEKKEITDDQYQFIISKINNNTDQNIIINQVLGNTKNELKFKNKAISFKRERETKTEDFDKELKKFILGICEAPKDDNSNPLSCISWLNNGEIKVLKEKQFVFIANNYTIFSDYLKEKYSTQYTSFENSLRISYINLSKNLPNIVNDEVKYEWYKYIINFDANILINLIYTYIASVYKQFDYQIDNSKLKSEFENFKTLALLLGIKKKDFAKILTDIQSELNEGKFYKFEINEDKYYQIIDAKKIQKDINLSNLIDISNKSTSENNLFVSSNRTRNENLINYLRSYYFTNFIDSKEKTIKCDCCSDFAFITYNDTPYIEFHHLIPFSTEFGPDHYLNLIGICPNCHRQMHFAKPQNRAELYNKTSVNNNMRLSLIHRINELFLVGLIEPIHLDFLKKEKIITAEQYEIYMNNQIIAA